MMREGSGMLLVDLEASSFVGVGVYREMFSPSLTKVCSGRSVVGLDMLGYEWGSLGSGIVKRSGSALVSLNLVFANCEDLN